MTRGRASGRGIARSFTVGPPTATRVDGGPTVNPRSRVVSKELPSPFPARRWAAGGRERRAWARGEGAGSGTRPGFPEGDELRSSPAVADGPYWCRPDPPGARAPRISRTDGRPLERSEKSPVTATAPARDGAVDFALNSSETMIHRPSRPPDRRWRTSRTSGWVPIPDRGHRGGIPIRLSIRAAREMYTQSSAA